MRALLKTFKALREVFGWRWAILLKHNGGFWTNSRISIGICAMTHLSLSLLLLVSFSAKYGVGANAASIKLSVNLIETSVY